jgi:hypothetical protein
MDMDISVDIKVAKHDENDGVIDLNKSGSILQTDDDINETQVRENINETQINKNINETQVDENINLSRIHVQDNKVVKLSKLKRSTRLRTPSQKKMEIIVGMQVRLPQEPYVERSNTLKGMDDLDPDDAEDTENYYCSDISCKKHWTRDSKVNQLRTSSSRNI